MIDFPIDDIKAVVSEKKYHTVICLLPAGVMPHAVDLREVIPNPIFVSNPCYGACDVPLELLKKYDAEAIFNFGHSEPIKFPKYGDGVHFFEIQVRGRNPKFIPPFNKVGLVYVIQFRETYMQYKEFLESNGKTVVLGGSPEFMATHQSQITGCDVEAAKSIVGDVDGFVVCSDGLFHANAVAALGKPAFNWNGDEAKAPKFPMAVLFTAKKVGVLIGAKPGQSYPKEAELVKKKLEKLGKTVITVVGDTITNEINNFQVDFWIIASCPRLAEDEYLSPSAPVKEVLKYI